MTGNSIRKASETGDGTGAPYSPVIQTCAFWRLKFDEAQRAAGGEVSCDWVTGGCRIRFQLAGPALMGSLLVGMEHLLELPSDDDVRFTVYLWDAASTGVPFVMDAHSPSDCMPGAVRNERVVARMRPDSEVARALSERGDEAWWTVRDARNLHYSCRDVPLRELLHVALLRVGMVLIHAAAVGFEDAAVLLVGPSGSGKSTATLACMDSGLCLVSEDFTALQPGACPSASGIYSTAKLNDDALRWFPKLVPHVSNPVHLAGEKNIIYLHHACPGQLARKARLKAVMIVSRGTGIESTVVPARKGDLLRTLAASTVQLMENAGAPQDGAKLLAAQASLLRQLPCFCLLVGSDLRQVGAAVRGLLESL